MKGVLLSVRICLPIILLAGLVLPVDVHSAPGGGRRKSRPPIVSFEKAVKRSVRSRLTVVGTIRPFRTSVVGSEIEGQVDLVPLREGDPVVAGKTIIARLRRTDLELGKRVIAAELAKVYQDYLRLKNGTRPEEIETYRARLWEKEAELKRDELEFKRSESLFKRKIIDQATLDRAEAKYQISKSQYLEEKSELRLAEMGPRREDIAKAAAELERVRAEIVRLKDLLSKTIIRSPLTGFLTEKSVEVGQWVTKGGRVGEVIEMRKVIVRAPVSEKKISFVNVGDTAQVRLDAIPGRVFTGRIARIIPKADTKSRTFPVEVELDNTSDFALKAGMFARIIMEYGAPVQSVLIPKDALLIRPRGASVFIFNEGRVREVSFKPGRNVDSFVEVPGGEIKPGMRVVVQGNEKLRNGMTVRLPGQRKGGPGGKKGRGKRPAKKSEDNKGRRG